MRGEPPVDLGALRNEQHLELSRAVRRTVLEGGPFSGSTELVVRAASVRRHLGQGSRLLS
jgi:hypothetical protein